MKKFYNIFKVLLMGTVAVGMAACGDIEREGSIGVYPASLSFTSEGSTQTLTVSVDDFNVNASAGWIETYVSGNTIAVTVGATAEGRSGYIVVENGDDSKTVTVTQSGVDDILVTSIELSESSLVLSAGEDETLIATVLPTEATNTTLQWSSDDTDVATVADGVVTAVGLGSATITAEATDGSGIKDECEVAVTPAMVFVEGGTFMMGTTAIFMSTPVHEVTLSDFSIGKFEITQAEWEAVMGRTITDQRDLAHEDLPTQEQPMVGEGDDYPVYYLHRADAEEFCTKLSQMTGLTFRLPTEAEWEFAAIGGNLSEGYKFSGSNTIGDVAWSADNSSNISHPVGELQPNELGLYDMSGNVFEWVSDWEAPYTEESQTNPTGPATGNSGILRGGDWGSYGVYDYHMPEYRMGYAPTTRNSVFGMRVVLIEE